MSYRITAGKHVGTLTRAERDAIHEHLRQRQRALCAQIIGADSVRARVLLRAVQDEISHLFEDLL